MRAINITGIAVIITGLLLILLGIFFAWGEYKQRRTLGPTDFVRAVKDLVVAIAEADRPSLGCFAFGTILVLVGGIIAGVGGLQLAQARGSWARPMLPAYRSRRRWAEQ